MEQNLPMGAGLSSGVSSAPTIDQERERLLPIIKDFRKSVDALIQQVPHPHAKALNADVVKLTTYSYNPEFTQAYEQVQIHLTDAKMWAGKLLEHLGNPFPAELADKAQ